MTSEERFKLRYLSENHNLTIKWADKGGTIFVMDTANHAEHCELLLRDRQLCLTQVVSDLGGSLSQLSQVEKTCALEGQISKPVLSQFLDVRRIMPMEFSAYRILSFDLWSKWL